MALTGQAPFNRRQFKSFALANVLDAPILPFVGSGAIAELQDIVAGSGGYPQANISSALSRRDIGPRSSFSKFRSGIQGISPPLTVSGSGAIIESGDIAFGVGSGPGYIVAALDPKRIGPQSPFSKFRDQRLGASLAPIPAFIIGSGALLEGADVVSGTAQVFLPYLSYLTSATLGPAFEAPFNLNQFKALQQGATSKPVILGSGSIAESADVVSGTGASAFVGSGAIGEGADIVSGSGTVSGSGSGAILENADVVAGSGLQLAIGSGTIIEGSDVVIGAGGTSGIGIGAIVEAQDLTSGTGAQSTSGAGAIIEGNDTVAGIGSSLVSIDGAGTIAELGDVVVGFGSASATGFGDIIEGADVMSTFAFDRIIVKPEANRTIKIE